MGTLLRLFRGEGAVAAAVIGIVSVGIWLTYLAAVLLGLRLYREILDSEQFLVSKVRRVGSRRESKLALMEFRRRQGAGGVR